jgi:hypothetical protein
MCDHCSTESADIYRELRRKARKEHHCRECGTLIRKGETYVYGSGIFEGAAFSLKFCQLCSRISDAHFAAARAIGEHCVPNLGELRLAVGSCSREEPKYRTAFREAWKDAA